MLRGLSARAVDGFEYLLLAGMFVLAFVTVPHFSNPTNLTNLVRQGSVLGILTCGETLLLLAGTFDLSVGSILSLVSVCTAVLLRQGFGAPIAVVGGLGVGALAGLVNATAIAWLKGNPVIVTLGSQAIFQGLALVATGGLFIGVRDPGFLQIGRGELLGIGYPVWIYLGLAAALQIALVRSRFGQMLYVIGTNSRVARLSGVRVDAYRGSLFVISGILAGLAAVVLIARTGDSSYLAGVNYEFNAITAAVLGGVALFGGSGSVARSVIGVLILTILANVQTLLGVPIYAQLFVEGGVLILTVWLQVAARHEGRESR
jgi:ribose/xylose/arabinose/galactoside ABC-type transport system permease subunit